MKLFQSGSGSKVALLDARMIYLSPVSLISWFILLLGVVFFNHLRNRAIARLLLGVSPQSMSMELV